MRSEYNSRQLCLMKQIQTLWEQHVYWTRFFIISTAADLCDLEYVTKRLLRNPDDFAQMLAPFFGERAACQFRKLFTEHLTIGGDLVNAAKDQDKKLANEIRKKWYQNADEISAFLASINQCWNESKWKCMFYSHLEMTEKEAALRLEGNYAADIEMFDMIEKEALQMAYYMFCGIINRMGCQ